MSYVQGLKGLWGLRSGQANRICHVKPPKCCIVPKEAPFES
ncbi:hypothetical protein HanPSC8_Chr02g0056771 [Helianthus annuus]|nr:hypothetical protein HanPSC8_Chr02g0056771 [Helianthus annuus]